MKNLLLVCAVTALLAPRVFAADSPWLGTWKLDPAKSHFTGETFTYSKAASGMMHYTDGSTTDTISVSTVKSTPLWRAEPPPGLRPATTPGTRLQSTKAPSSRRLIARFRQTANC